MQTRPVVHSLLVAAFLVGMVRAGLAGRDGADLLSTAAGMVTGAAVVVAELAIGLLIRRRVQRARTGRTTGRG